MIVTVHVFPPIPNRNYDWLATVDGDPEGPVGFGPTELEAVKHLAETLSEALDKYTPTPGK